MAHKLKSSIYKNKKKKSILIKINRTVIWNDRDHNFTIIINIINKNNKFLYFIFTTKT